MKATELKIGDWVVYKDLETHEDVLFQIERWEGNVACGGQTRLFSNNLTPVPLTEEILEKNGWKERKYSEHIAYENGWYELFRVGQEGSWAFCHYDDFLTSIEYVHELQHLLWALGIDDDLKI